MTGQLSEATPGQAIVLDASCLLASAFGEPGAEQVRGLLPVSLISAANWSEFVQKVLQRGIRIEGMRQELEGAGLRIMPVTAEHAEAAAGLWSATRAFGLSLGDRLCLALALAHQATAYTADRAWTQAKVGVPVVCVRPSPAVVHKR